MSIPIQCFMSKQHQQVLAVAALVGAALSFPMVPEYGVSSAPSPVYDAPRHPAPAYDAPRRPVATHDMPAYENQVTI